MSAAGFYEDGGEGFYGDDSAVELHLAGAFEDTAGLGDPWGGVVKTTKNPPTAGVGIIYKGDPQAGLGANR